MPSRLEPPQRRLLLAAAAVTPDSVRRAALRDAARALARDAERDGGTAPWEALCDAATRHGVAPLLALALRDADAADTLPAATRDALDAAARRTTASTLLQHEVLHRTLATLAGHGVAPLVWKGPTLAWLYEAPGLRDHGDLDLLVRLADLDRATTALEAAGFRRPRTDSPAQARMRRRTFHEAVFVRGGQHVDLHWCLAKRVHAVPYETDGLCERHRTVPVGSRDVPTLGPDDTVLGLCIHGSSHAWQRLVWVADIARCLHRDRAVDWARVCATADAGGYLRMVLVPVLLARRLLGAPVPPPLDDHLRRDATVGRLADLVEAGLFGDGGELDAFRRFHFALRDRLAPRLRFALRAAFTPAPADWEWVTLPDVAWPLYYLVRPLRLAWKYGRPRRA
jgi:hypothetical protein